jgi:hypothetical protein
MCSTKEVDSKITLCFGKDMDDIFFVWRGKEDLELFCVDSERG